MKSVNNIDERTGNPKIILHLCAKMGSDSAVYKEKGYDVRIIGEEIGVENYNPPDNVYGIIANPPCTMFSLARTRAKTPRDLREGMSLVKECLRIIWECQYRYDIKKHGYKTSLKFWCLENPFGFLNFFLGKPVMIYQPFEFGEVYSKKTCLWGNFNIPQVLPLFVNKNKTLNLIGRGSIKDYKSISTLTSSTRTDLRSKCSPKFAQAFFEVNQ